ncbi:ABC transporter permease [Falsiroseomonas oryzae]|uniref:ABC transporter permease n=1 Tax=Falsiroseomonas oryzae TaxID=2766473 RepID=UPI0022EB2552|nr:ABC transporter permease [Roseomonas sp. MO-31]
MLAVMARRMAAALPTLAGVVVVTFLLARALPGDPAAYFAGPAATREAVEQIRAALGLDRPLHEQFLLYLRDLARGDLGVSITTGQPVLHDILARLPASAELTLLGLLFAATVGITLGVLAALKPNGWLDNACRVVATLGVCLPAFFTGLLLIYVFYYLLGWAPAPLGRLDAFSSPPPYVTGFFLVDSLLAGDAETFVSAAQQIALPAIALGIFAVAPIARITRGSMLAVMGSDFIRAARAHGLSRRKVVVAYALRNALLPVVTTLGMVFSFLLGANVLVEKVFAWPGIGSYAVEALLVSDYAPVQGFVMTMGFLYVLLNLAIDLLYRVIDPRVEVAA